MTRGSEEVVDFNEEGDKCRAEANNAMTSSCSETDDDMFSAITVIDELDNDTIAVDIATESHDGTQHDVVDLVDGDDKPLDNDRLFFDLCRTSVNSHTDAVSRSPIHQSLNTLSPSIASGNIEASSAGVIVDFDESINDSGENDPVDIGHNHNSKILSPGESIPYQQKVDCGSNVSVQTGNEHDNRLRKRKGKRKPTRIQPESSAYDASKIVLTMTLPRHNWLEEKIMRSCEFESAQIKDSGDEPVIPPVKYGNTGKKRGRKRKYPNRVDPVDISVLESQMFTECSTNTDIPVETESMSPLSRHSCHRTSDSISEDVTVYLDSHSNDISDSHNGAIENMVPISAETRQKRPLFCLEATLQNKSKPPRRSGSDTRIDSNPERPSPSVPDTLCTRNEVDVNSDHEVHVTPSVTPESCGSSNRHLPPKKWKTGANEASQNNEKPSECTRSPPLTVRKYPNKIQKVQPTILSQEAEESGKPHRTKTATPTLTANEFIPSSTFAPKRVVCDTQIQNELCQETSKTDPACSPEDDTQALKTTDAMAAYTVEQCSKYMSELSSNTLMKAVNETFKMCDDTAPNPLEWSERGDVPYPSVILPPLASEIPAVSTYPADVVVGPPEPIRLERQVQPYVEELYPRQEPVSSVRHTSAFKRCQAEKPVRPRPSLAGLSHPQPVIPTNTKYPTYGPPMYRPPEQKAQLASPSALRYPTRMPHPHSQYPYGMHPNYAGYFAYDMPQAQPVSPTLPAQSDRDPRYQSMRMMPTPSASFMPRAAATSVSPYKAALPPQQDMASSGGLSRYPEGYVPVRPIVPGTTRSDKVSPHPMGYRMLPHEEAYRYYWNAASQRRQQLSTKYKQTTTQQTVATANNMGTGQHFMPNHYMYRYYHMHNNQNGCSPCFDPTCFVKYYESQANLAKSAKEKHRNAITDASTACVNLQPPYQ